MTKYPYQPLKQGEFRLVTLHKAADDEDELHITISTASLKDMENKYAALSYVWGSDAKTQRVLVTGMTNHALVTESVYQALHCLRFHHLWRSEPFLIWIDAICINQEDDVEKGEQVAMMTEIYTQATKAYAFLGEEADDSDEAFDFLIKLNEKLALEPDTEMTMDKSRWLETPSLDEFVAAAIILQLDDEHTSVIIAVSKLLSRPWFERVWIVQEVIVSKDVELVCGSKSLHFGEFVHTFIRMGIGNNHAVELVTIRSEVAVRITSMFMVHEVRTNWQARAREDFLTLLIRNSTRKATRARDHMFALSGIAGNLATLLSNGLQLRYDIPFEQVVRSAAISLVYTYGLPILAYCGVGSHSDRFPSYSGDWTTMIGQKVLDITTYSALTEAEYTTHVNTSKWSFDKRPGTIMPALRVAAKQFDTIDWIAPAIDVHSPPSDRIQIIDD